MINAPGCGLEELQKPERREGSGHMRVVFSFPPADGRTGESREAANRRKGK